MPKPHDGESREDFISRCMADPDERELRPDQDARFARCNGIFDSERSTMPSHKQLLEAIRNRQIKNTEFGYGITTADRYVKTLEMCVGHDVCNRYACVKGADWSGLITKAANTLVYSNEDMLTGDKLITSLTGWKEVLGIEDSSLELPKNTLMVFSHTLTTPRKDRDGDRLRSEGARLDRKMLMLWQHIPTLPIGKLLAILEQNEKRVRNASCLIDMNDLCHDAAVMIDNGMGRYSHGFRALAFNDLKEDYDPETGPAGYDITSFEIMEESLVSVPSNVDAETDEVVLSLVEGGKLTSDLMKARGRAIREHRPLSLNITKNIGEEHEDKSRSGSSAAEAGREDKGHCTCASKEANEEGTSSQASESGDTQVTEDKAAVCSECGGEMKDGKCEKCGHEAGKSVKAGRVLSQRNLTKLKDVVEDLEELKGGVHISTRAGSAICERCIKTLGEVIGEAGSEVDETEDSRQVSVDQAIGTIISDASKDERVKLKRYLEALESAEASYEVGVQFRNLIAS